MICTTLNDLYCVEWSVLRWMICTALNDLYYVEWFALHSFFIRTSKFCLSLAVLNYFSFLRLKCSKFAFISPTEPFNATKKNVRLSTIKTHYFISFILFLSSSAHRQPLGGVLQKSGSATVLKPIKKYLQMSSIFHSQVFFIDFEYRYSWNFVD